MSKLILAFDDNDVGDGGGGDGGDGGDGGEGGDDDPGKAIRRATVAPPNIY